MRGSEQFYSLTNETDFVLDSDSDSGSNLGHFPLS